MGNYYCRLRRNKEEQGEARKLKQNQLIENEIYLPGSLEYLNLVGMDQVG